MVLWGVRQIILFIYLEIFICYFSRDLLKSRYNCNNKAKQASKNDAIKIS